MREYLSQLIKFCGTGTDPAAETKSIGLLAFACGYGEQSRPTLWRLARPNDRSTKLKAETSSSFGRAGFLLATWTVSS
jgi:hypothetical protein